MRLPSAVSQMYTASSSEDTLSTVSRRSAPASSMRYLALAHSRVSSLYQADSMSGIGTSHWNMADAFSGTSRSCRRFLKGSVGSAEEGPDERGGEGKRGRLERRQRLGVRGQCRGAGKRLQEGKEAG